MRNITYYKIIVLLSAILLFSCSDKSLDVVNKAQLTDQTLWSSAANSSLFLNDIYNNLNPGPQSTVFTNLPSEISNDPLDNFSDNSLSGPLAGIPSYSNFAAGAYGPSTPIFDEHWAAMYANIRKCNLFIQKVSGAGFDEDQKKPLIAQAKFLRAYFYKWLVDMYGGVPIITDVLNLSVNGDSIFRARNTYDECIAFIQQDCLDAFQDLPLKVSGSNVGRATKGAALALKGELELYAGKWADAAATNLQIMQLGAGYDLFPDYSTLFYTSNENNQEVIFDIQYLANIRGHIREKYWNPIKVSDGSGWGSVDPTQDLVDSYEFLDGKTESEGSSLFNPADPYANRDKRFAASIIYDGSSWKNGIIYTRIGIANNNNEVDLSGSAGRTRTGYFLKKMVDPAIVPGNSSGENAIVWRYAEVLLNYAEAKNELSGPDPTIFDAVNKVRTRAGLPNLPTNLSKDELRQRIRRERRIELAFEGKRLFDLWRWKMAPDVFSSPLKAIKITSSANGLIYEKVNAGGGQIKFDPTKNYLFPIPQKVISANPKLIQNPNYK